MLTPLDKGPWRYFYRLINPVVLTLIRRFGVGGPPDDLLRVLRVRGRTSARIYDVPVRITPLRGEQFIVAMFGTAQWVKNLRATGAAEIVLGRAAEPVQVHELHGEDKAAFVIAYVNHPKLATRARAALRTDPRKLSPDELQQAMAVFPVFRLVRLNQGLDIAETEASMPKTRLRASRP